MAKSIKLKNNTYWDTSCISHNKKLLYERLEHSGTIATLGLSGNWKPSQIGIATIIPFDQMGFTRTGVFSYSNGEITVLSDAIKGVIIEYHLRCLGMYIYIWSSSKGCVLGDTGYTSGTVNKNGSISISVSKGEKISIRCYAITSSSVIAGASPAWAGATITSY